MTLTRRGWAALVACLVAVSWLVGWYAFDLVQLAAYATFEHTGLTLPGYPTDL